MHYEVIDKFIVGIVALVVKMNVKNLFLNKTANITTAFHGAASPTGFLGFQV